MISGDTDIMSTQTFDVAFDKAPKMSEKKVVNPTIDLIKRVLREGGLDEGSWTLKNPSRNRKKGSERFRAIRIEHWGVRVRCKPGGNDTCWEYILNPPAGTDPVMVFDVLSRVHPVRLEIPESVRLPKAILIRMAGIDDLIPKPGHKPHPEPLVASLGEDNQNQGKGTELEEETYEAEEKPLGLEECATATARGAGPSFVPRPFSPPPLPRWSVEKRELTVEKNTSLELFEACLLSDEEAMDRALIAIAYVSVGGYAKRIPASNSIIENLNINKFIKEISNGTYNSINGAMRAITMALTSAGYIERIACTSNSTRGYRLTEKAEKRINALRRVFDESIFSNIKPGWNHHENKVEPDDPPSEPEAVPVSEVKTGGGLEEESLGKAFSIMDNLKEIVEQINQVDGFLKNLQSEKSDLEATKAGFEITLSQKAEKLKELQEEIARISGKIGDIDTTISQKDREIEDWKRYQEPYILDRDRLTLEVKKLVGA